MDIFPLNNGHPPPERHVIPCYSTFLPPPRAEAQELHATFGRERLGRIGFLEVLEGGDDFFYKKIDPNNGGHLAINKKTIYILLFSIKI